MKKAIYPITDDICFKYLFRNKKILTDLLNSFYEYIHETKKVLDLRVSTNKEIIGSNRRRKVFYGDILVYLNTDEIASIEMYNLCEASHKLYYEKKKIMRSCNLNP